MQYIVVDDDVTNNLICEYNIKSFDTLAEVKSFTQPELALDFLKENGFEREIILLLDLNMPTMTGWEFLERFSDLNSRIKNSVSIYILSSAIGNEGEDFVRFPFVKGCFSKPLCRSYIEEISSISKS